jgi:DNA polymerase III epsilon subunit family exonuclease
MMQDAPSEFVALDLETTGLSPQTERIVEIGAVRFRVDGEELGRFQSLVNPRRPMPYAAQRIHGISDADLVGAPGIETVLPRFLNWLTASCIPVLMAHNARFDASFLTCELDRLGLRDVEHDVHDTLDLARRRLPHLASHRLDYLARALALDPDGPHRALADSLRVKDLWIALKGHEAQPITYRIRASAVPPVVPRGWDQLADAVAAGRRLRIEYEGGSRGTAPREITPQRFLHKGGIVYLLATCHLDFQDKAFRLDRLTRFEIVDARVEPVVGANKPFEGTQRHPEIRSATRRS